MNLASVLQAILDLVNGLVPDLEVFVAAVVVIGGAWVLFRHFAVGGGDATDPNDPDNYDWSDAGSPWR